MLMSGLTACGGGTNPNPAAETVATVTDATTADATTSVDHASQLKANSPQAAATVMDPGCTAVSTRTCAMAQSLGRGINLGNMLEAPHEGQWGITFHSSYARVIKAAGFTHVRLPIRWSNHARPTEDATLDPSFAARVDSVVRELLNAGLMVIINQHHYRQLDGDSLDDNEDGVPDPIVQARAIQIWRQVARRYADASDKLLFELYNEPHGRQDGSPWNLLYPQLLAAVRETNPQRTVLIGPSGWNASWALQAFAVPVDRNVIVEVHNYEPHAFTHQGAWGSGYAGGSATCCSPAQARAFTDALDTAVTWSKAHGLPVYVGEFGSHISAPEASRIDFARMARTEMEARKMSWAAWNFGADFAVYDTTRKAWNAPLLEALMP